MNAGEIQANVPAGVEEDVRELPPSRDQGRFRERMDEVRASPDRVAEQRARLGAVASLKLSLR